MQLLDDVTVLTECETVVKGEWADGQPYVSTETIEALLGWQLKPEGLCRNEVCIPISDQIGSTVADSLNLEDTTRLIGRPILSDPENNVIAIGQPYETRSLALNDRVAPNFTLTDIAGVNRSLSDWTGKKRLLVAFSSW
tara:strand:+ start:850 stop:1266 length:417 start_codon:yes stop_codon:yes gene_type:complete